MKKLGVIFVVLLFVVLNQSYAASDLVCAQRKGNGMSMQISNYSGSNPTYTYPNDGSVSISNGDIGDGAQLVYLIGKYWTTCISINYSGLTKTSNVVNQAANYMNPIPFQNYNLAHSLASKYNFTSLPQQGYFVAQFDLSLSQPAVGFSVTCKNVVLFKNGSGYWLGSDEDNGILNLISNGYKVYLNCSGGQTVSLVMDNTKPTKVSNATPYMFNVELN